MNISSFFISRPVFATALSIIIALVGVMSMRALPIAQYPDVVPPEVMVTASDPGANAETVSQTVASVLAENINGVQDMLYMYSTSSNDGSMQMHVSFAIGSDGNIDTVNVTNRVQTALSSLPSSVQQQGVNVQLRSSSILMFATLNSHEYDQTFLRNFATLHVIDELKQVSGVGDAEVLGSSTFAMRVWLNPDKLAQYNITPEEVSNAISAQNSEVSAGGLASSPMAHPRPYSYTILTKGRLTTANEFRNIILRTNPDGSSLHLGDVARVELGNSSYNIDAKMNGESIAPILISQQPGANALKTADAVKAKLASLSKRFPAGVSYDTPYDTTLFINASVHSVTETFIDALILVAIIVFVFLQNWRTTAIAMSVVPISVIGTFSGMYALGFSINLLSLFGMILAIGIVVDDAILVVENVERLLEDDKDISVFDAVMEAMKEVGGPVLATAFIMASVFVPVGVLGGLTGEIFRQFAITIAISVAISAFVALTFTPALTAILLKRKHESNNPIVRLLEIPFRIFDRIFDAITHVYMLVVRFFVRMWVISLALFVLVTAVALWTYQNTATSLIPQTDQGLYIVSVNTPDGSSVTRTSDYISSISDQLRKLPGVKYVTQVAGYDMLSSSANTARGVIFVSLKPWSERSVSVDQLIGRTMKIGAQTPGGSVIAFNMPPIIGLSTTGGLEGYLTSLDGASSSEMQQAVYKLQAAAKKNPALSNVFSSYDANVPSYMADIDYNKAMAYGVGVSDINKTLGETLGSSFVNYFSYQGRQFQVYVQNDSDYRATANSLENIYVRSSNGARLPLSQFVNLRRISAPNTVMRFNVYNAALFNGAPGNGYSSGQAVQALQDEVQKTLGSQWEMNWTGTTYQETHAGGGASSAIIFGILMIILILAAQYESWSIPIAVITAVPFGFFGAIMAVVMRGLSVSVYVEVGMLVVVGLAAKNAILIVEFAQQLRRDHGMSINEAAAEAGHLRFRPIIMTSLAFICGVLPLAFATGAADANSHEIGTTVAGGMLGVAILGSLLIPSYYAMIAHMQAWWLRKMGKEPVEGKRAENEHDRNDNQGEGGAQRSIDAPRSQDDQHPDA